MWVDDVSMLEGIGLELDRYGGFVVRIVEIGFDLDQCPGSEVVGDNIGFGQVHHSDKVS